MTIEELYNEILSLQGIEGIEFFTLGYSTMGQPIYAVHIGEYTGNQILIEAGIHAREYPSTLVVVGMLKYLATIPLDGGIYAIPLVNPDGARIVLEGIDWLTCEKYREYLRNINSNSDDYSQWKASATTVDLNVNFDALWGAGSQNVFCPAPGNFIGFYPESEREVRMLIEFSYRVQPSLTLSYHTKGNVIYYGFETLSAEQLARDQEIASYIGSINGYIPIKTENSVGGYSDWVSEYLGVPAFTVEIGDANLPTPIPLDSVPDAIERNKTVPSELLTRLKGVENEF